MTWSVRGTGGRSENEHTYLHRVYLCCLLFVCCGDEREREGGEREKKGFGKGRESIILCGSLEGSRGLMCGGEGRASLAGELMSAAVFIARGFKDWEFDIYIHLQSECSN